MPEALVEGVSFADLSESEYVELMQDNLTSFMERLNFSAQDSFKLLYCLRSLMHALGCANGAYDEKALEEVGEDDQIVADGDAAGGPEVFNAYAFPPRHVSQLQPPPPTPPSPPPSSSPSSPMPQDERRPLRIPCQVPSSGHVQQPAESPEVPLPPPPPHPEMLARHRRVAPAVAPKSRCRGVKRPYEELAETEQLPILVSGMCPQCKVPRADCFRPGDWGCPLCGQHNYSSKLVCSNYRCLAKRGVVVQCAPLGQQAPPIVVPGPSSSWCFSCHRPRSECWKPNDWECPWCKNHNYARKQVVAAECSAGLG